jgi:NAD(P)H-dependent FMN reductase
VPVLQVVIASTRPTRVGPSVASWFVERAERHAGFSVEVIDLAHEDLPMLDEPHHPKLGRYENATTKAWSSTIARGDAFVVVMPEYNYGYTAPIKNALDHLYAEWNDKAIGFVSYGGVAGGARAVQMLKQVVTTLKMHPVFDGVYVPFVASRLAEDGSFTSDDALDASADAMLDELVRVDAALASLRTA